MSSNPSRILCIDDDGMVRYLSRATLELQGYDVVTAEDGSDALEILQAEGTDTFDLVLLDLMMQNVDGVTVLTRLRTEMKSSLPVIIYSAVSQKEIFQTLMKLGVSAFLRKPAEIADLVETVKYTLTGGTIDGELVSHSAVS